MPPPLPAAPDVATQSLADELAEVVHRELLEMVRLLQEADPAALFGETEFKVRALALRIAAQAYQQRLAQKKMVTTGRA